MINVHFILNTVSHLGTTKVSPLSITHPINPRK